MRRPISPVLTLIFLAAMGAMALTLPGPRLMPFPYCTAGLVPVCAGLAICLAGRAQFIRAGTCLSPFRRPRALVVHGLFRYSRNPMYLGLSILEFGAAIALGALTPFALAAVFVVVIDRVYIPAEERALTRVFGNSYIRYMSMTPRWV